ncbi:MAG: glycosyltransferase [Candidatus Lokiarchaeia archaeon]
MKEKKINDNFIIHYLPFHAPGINAGVIRLLFFFIKFLLYSIIKVFKIIQKEKIDLIHAHSPPPSGFIAFFFHRFLKIPYFYSIHGIEVPNQYISNLDINLIAQNSQKTFVVSRTLKKYLNTNYKVKNISWFPNIIQTAKYYHVNNEQEKDEIIQNLNLNFILQKEDFIISYIGYMIFKQKVKGMIDFLDGFYLFLKKIQLKTEQEKIKLIYIGDGVYSTLLEEKVKQLDLKNNIFILGRRNDVKDILAISDLLALTSYIEGSPNVLLEAMAAKVPCLGTNVGEIKNIIGDTGYIVKPGDYLNIERKIESFYRLSKNERVKLMEKAYKRVKYQFDINIIGNELIKLYLKYKKSI